MKKSKTSLCSKHIITGFLIFVHNTTLLFGFCEIRFKTFCLKINRSDSLITIAESSKKPQDTRN